MIYDIKIKNFGPFGDNPKDVDYLKPNFYYSSISNPIINIIGDNNLGKTCLISVISWSINWEEEKYKNLMKKYQWENTKDNLEINYIFDFDKSKKFLVSKSNSANGFFSTIKQKQYEYWYIDKSKDINKNLFNDINGKIDQRNWDSCIKNANLQEKEISELITSNNSYLCQIDDEYSLEFIFNLCNNSEENKYINLLKEINELFFNSESDHLKLEEYNTTPKWKNCSIGTKWFFTICFEIIQIIENNLGIYCIDEPEKYLSIPNQKKLFKFIKDKIENFSKNKKINFQIFIATNSPYMMDNEFLFNSKIIFQNKNKTSILANNIECFNRRWKCFDVLPIENILKILGIDFNEENWINNLLNKVFFVEGAADFYFLKILFKLNDDLRKYFNNIFILPMSGRDKLKNLEWQKIINSCGQRLIFLDSDNDNNYRESKYKNILLFLNDLYNSDRDSAIDRFGPEDLLEEETRKKYNINEKKSENHAIGWFNIYLDFYENKENVFSEKDVKTLKNVANEIYNKTNEIYNKQKKNLNNLNQEEFI